MWRTSLSWIPECCSLHMCVLPPDPGSGVSYAKPESNWDKMAGWAGRGDILSVPNSIPPLSAVAKTEDGTPPRPPIPKRRKRNIGHIILFLNLFLFSDVTSLCLFSLMALVFPSKKHDSEYRLTFFLNAVRHPALIYNDGMALKETTQKYVFVCRIHSRLCRNGGASYVRT